MTGIILCNGKQTMQNEIMLVKSYTEDGYDDLQKFFANLSPPKKSLLKNQLLNIAIRYSNNDIKCRDGYTLNSKRLIQIQKSVKNQIALSDMSIKYGYKCVYYINITLNNDCGIDKLPAQLLSNLLSLKASIQVITHKC